MIFKYGLKQDISGDPNDLVEEKPFEVDIYSEKNFNSVVPIVIYKEYERQPKNP